MRIDPRRSLTAPPPSPGDVLRGRLVAAAGITQDKLALAMNVSRFSVNQIVNGKRAVTAEMAMRLGRVTGTSAEFWLNLQRNVDLYDAENKLAKEIETLPVLLEPLQADEFAEVD